MSDLESDGSNRLAEALVAFTGIGYFAAWSISFYPQILLNYKRKKTTGLSADFIIVNPVGFLTLTLWNWGVRFSPLAQKQYRHRHHGHSPQISNSDLAFSLHALIISTITLSQVSYYAWKNHRKSIVDDDEGEPLLERTTPQGSTIKPSITLQIALVGIFGSAFVAGILVWTGSLEWLDWLYFVSTLKLLISVVKYVPQVILNFRLKSAQGLAIWVIILDLTGSVLSFVQLVISSIWIEKDPSGIIANPAKLGLSLLSILFDVIFIVQNYVLYPNRKIDEEGEEDPDGP